MIDTLAGIRRYASRFALHFIPALPPPCFDSRMSCASHSPFFSAPPLPFTLLSFALGTRSQVQRPALSFCTSYSFLYDPAKLALNPLGRTALQSAGACQMRGAARIPCSSRVCPASSVALCFVPSYISSAHVLLPVFFFHLPAYFGTPPTKEEPRPARGSPLGRVRSPPRPP